ncbi:terminase small subunit [Clostridium perfringens]|uniref:terminase small subunit n=1 Tax=Clostridium perfringens TaxID=1502 RepID=UPI000F53DCED|nr:terminase small subunit [Clostridium perfringens]MDK3222630.1 terminase small subunit [Clostridium perfringens]MDV5090088.1 terminase small subunit [Clostridium perfringens]MDV5108138.1 terminase small subunit [Clostridium perfringens]MDZ5014791.1 terminase small subunit [Clostridium perfringens]RQN17378.1 terminase small subunit [Clostridium perfringens]
MKLTPKQKAFAEYYIETGNATESAIKAGYSKKTARVIGQENLLKPALKSYIDEKMKELESKRIAKAEEVLEYLTRVLRGEETEQVVVTENIGDFMSEAKVVDKEISAKDKIKAAELLGKRYRLFVDKVEKDSKVNVNSTTKLDSILNQLKDDDNE